MVVVVCRICSEEKDGLNLLKEMMMKSFKAIEMKSIETFQYQNELNTASIYLLLFDD